MLVGRRPLGILALSTLCALSCNGREFTAQGEVGGAAGVGGDSRAGAAGANVVFGGASGSAHAGGGGGASSSAGEAGTAGSKPCSCALGQYCAAGTTTCRSCKDFSELRFEKPQRLSTLSHGAQADQRFPRPGPKDTDLFYRFGSGTSAELWYSPNPVTGFGVEIELDSTLSVGGPLFVTGVYDGFNLLYDLEQAGVHSLKMSNWDGEKLTATSDVPVPLAGADDFGVAVATKTARAWWMSDRKSKGTPKLVTESTTAGTKGAEVEVVITLSVGISKCERSVGNATPWVTPDGTLLLFRNPTLDASCASSDGIATDLYAVALDVATGLPKENARALDSLNVTHDNASETDPALSADACFIYFASNNGVTDGYHAVFRAARN